MSLQVTETIKVNYFIESNKTWTIYKFIVYKDNMDKIISIPILVNNIQDKFDFEITSGGRFKVTTVTWTNKTRFIPIQGLNCLNTYGN